MTSNLFANLPNTPEATEKAPKAPVVTQTEVAPTEPVTSAVSVPESAESDTNTDVEDDTPKVDELTMLKSRATLMNISYSNNIGIEALKAKITNKLNNEQDNTDSDGNEITKEPEVINENQVVENKIFTSSEPNKPLSAIAKKAAIRARLHKEQMALIRVRITNLDPKKATLPGEIFTVANEYIGTVRKFVPYGEITDNGYHLPICIYNQLKERTFVSIKTRKGPRGQTIVENQNAKEFAFDVLTPLTPAELAQLATTQQSRSDFGLE